MNEIFDRTEQVIAEEIRPAIQRDGGTIQLVKIDEHGVAWVELKGACAKCSASSLTMRAGVERILRKRISFFARTELLLRRYLAKNNCEGELLSTKKFESD
jgi:Fe-S cluster biogenesis protein NfuA